jgi:hypothetical protein
MEEHRLPPQLLAARFDVQRAVGARQGTQQEAGHAGQPVERHLGKVEAVAVSMEGRIDVGAGVARQLVEAEVELRLARVP